MWHKKNADPSAYRKGVCHAHRNISAWSSLNHWNKKTRMDMAAKLHDEADKDQYEIRASKGGKACQGSSSLFLQASLEGLRID